MATTWAKYMPFDEMDLIFNDRYSNIKQDPDMAKARKPLKMYTEDMNLKRIKQALSVCPRGNTELFQEWIKGTTYSEEEKRIISSIIIKYVNREDILLPEGYLEENIQRKDGEALSKYKERGSSFVIESYMCSNYRGFLKHLLCSLIPSLRGADYEPEILESDGNIKDSLTNKIIIQGDPYYDLVSLNNDHWPLTEESMELLKRADFIMRRSIGNDYFYI